MSIKFGTSAIMAVATHISGAISGNEFDDAMRFFKDGAWRTVITISKYVANESRIHPGDYVKFEQNGLRGKLSKVSNADFPQDTGNVYLVGGGAKGCAFVRIPYELGKSPSYIRNTPIPSFTITDGVLLFTFPECDVSENPRERECIAVAVKKAIGILGRDAVVSTLKRSGVNSFKQLSTYGFRTVVAQLLDLAVENSPVRTENRGGARPGAGRPRTNPNAENNVSATLDKSPVIERTEGYIRDIATYTEMLIELMDLEGVIAPATVGPAKAMFTDIRQKNISVSATIVANRCGAVMDIAVRHDSIKESTVCRHLKLLFSDLRSVIDANNILADFKVGLGE